MELMGIGSSRINGTSQNRLYACLGLRRFTGKESKDHSARRDDKQREKTKEQDKEVLEALYLFAHHALSHRVFKTHLQRVNLLRPSPINEKTQVVSHSESPSTLDNSLSRNSSLLGLINILPSSVWYCITTSPWPMTNGLARGPTTRSTAKTLIRIIENLLCLKTENEEY
jgi:hypothetical protein